MSVRGTAIIIGIVALAVVVTYGVEELRHSLRHRELTTQVAEHRAAREQLEASRDSLRSRNRELEQQIEQTRTEHQEEIGRLSAQIAELRAAHQEAEHLSSQVSSLKDERTRLQERITALTEELARERNRRSTLELAWDRAKSRLHQLGTLAHELQTLVQEAIQPTEAATSAAP